MKSYKYFLLDWDGNLVKTLDLWLAALKESLRRRGYNFSDQEIGANFAAFSQRMEGRIEDISAVIDEAETITARRLNDVDLYPEALETLAYLRTHGKKLALVTTSSHAQIDPLLEKYAMQQMFDAVVCGDDVLYGKPDAEPLELAIKLMGGNKKATIMVGDSGNDITAAKNAGVDSALFYPPDHEIFYDIQKLKLLQPTYVIEDFRKLRNLI